MRKNQLSSLSQYYLAFNRIYIISTTDTKGIITSVNKNFCTLSGYSEKELIGNQHNIVRHPDTNAKVFEQMWKTITSGKIWKGTIKNAKKEKGFYWTKAVIFPIFDDKKNIVEYISFREDITKQKQQEDKFKEERNLRREILNAQPNMAILVHMTKGVIFMNAQTFMSISFDSRVDFLAKHECICELFIEGEGLLKKSTPERHWLLDFTEFPDRKHQAILLNRDNIEQKYDVEIKVMEDNEDLIVVNFLKTTEITSPPSQSTLEMKLLVAISAIASMEDVLDPEGEEIQRLHKIKDLLKI